MKAEKIKVPFGTISIPDSSKEMIMEILESKRVSSGKYVRHFEEKFAGLFGVKEAVAVSSGTDADILAMAVLHDYGAKRDDEIIVPALSFVATGNAVFHAGFKPVFVDIEYETLNIDPSKIEAAITEKTKAIMPVHLMGKPADMDKINIIAKRYNLIVIEDSAEAHGAKYKGKMVGTLSDMAAFSLYVAHIITTVEGGVVITNNESYAEILRSLRSHGRACKCRECTLNTSDKLCQKRFHGENAEDIRFKFERIGYSCKMNEIEAAIGIGNIDIFSEILGKRRKNLIYFLESFRKFKPYLDTIQENDNEKIGPHAIPIIVRKEAKFTRNQLSNYLEEMGIETRTLFASMPTQCPGFAHLGYKIKQFPVAEYMGNNGIHIGVHQDLEIKDMDYVLDVIKNFIEKHQK